MSFAGARGGGRGDRDAGARAQSCSLCFEAFETTAPPADEEEEEEDDDDDDDSDDDGSGSGVERDRRPRVLACGHSFCGWCLHKDMQQRRW